MQQSDAHPPAPADAEAKRQDAASSSDNHPLEATSPSGTSTISPPVSSGMTVRADDGDALGIDDPALLDSTSSGDWPGIDNELDIDRDAELYVVGVGASAGGLDALEQFFGAMPEDTGMAFVVIQHLSPDFKSVMDELLARRTKIPVVLVEDGMRVEANHIYLIPPKKEMIISGGKLLLSDKGASQELMLPIDIFFRSLAQDLGEHAIGIVLSGAGSDGARGIRDIHDAGGLVLCQDESSAYFDGMPRSARETGVVDYVLPPMQMPSALIDHARDPDGRRRSQALEHSPTRPYGVTAALRFLQNAYGIDFSHYKPSTVVRRIERRLQLTQSETLEAYVERLAHDNAELDDLFHDLLIGVTRFFRDEGAFECLESRIIPELVERTRTSEELRVWVAGCATGEEAYSVAILVQEELRKRRARCRLKILATDLHRGSLDFASRGLYTEDRVSRVRSDLLERYFDRRGPNYQVSPELRQCVVFAPHNVIKDAPFTRIDLVTCRNLLIYLQPLAQKKVLGLLHFALKRNGVLMLGPSEHVGPLVDDFEAVDVHWRIYRKHRDLRQSSDVSRLAPQRPIAISGEPRPGALGGYSLSQTVSVYDSLLDEYMPPSLLVNERRELVHAFAGASRYLKVKEGRPSNDLLDMIGPDLKMAVTGAMQRALKDRMPVAYAGLSLLVDGQPKPHRLLVKPVGGAGHTQHVLITIDPLEGDPRPPPPSQSELDLDAVSRDQVGSLEGELRRTRESLQATIEELETSNEELQATNEELLASNEELQSTNEELQSVNEELYTVNAEYQKKIAELTELTNDMDNLLASIQVGTIFLDRKLCIRKFTPLIAEVFNLLPQDVGRPIAGFSTSLNQVGLLDDLAQVLRTERAIEREVQGRGDSWFFQRILPYRMRGTVHGVVLTLIDIGPLKAAENAVFRERYLLDSLMDSVPDAIYFKDAAGRFVRVNAAMAERLGLKNPAAAVGHAAKDFLSEASGRAIDEADERALAGEAQPYDEEQVTTETGKVAWYMSTRQPLQDASGKRVGMLAVSRDISVQKHIEDEIRLAVRRRDEFLAMLSHELRNPLAAIVNAGVLLHSKSAAPSTREKGLQVIERQSRQMTRLLDDLLEVSRITQGKIELRKQVIDARQVANDALVALRERFSSRGIELSVDLGPLPVWVEADPARLQQILVNLLDNAAKYTAAKFPHSGDSTPTWTSGSPPRAPRSGAVAPPLSGGRAALELRVRNQEAVFTITDNGIGIDPSLLDTIFEPFVQGATTIHRTEGGMGVGLSVVRSLVTMHEGRIGARSEGIGHGSTFVVSLPLAPSSAIVPAARRSTPWPAGKRVVVIEDNQDGAEMLSLLLEHAGYEVYTAEDGKSGIELIERVGPNVALVDIGLPVMDGFEVARWVRTQSAHRDLYLLALTGYGQAGDRAAALQAGFDEHLVKPVDAEKLRQLMQGKEEAAPRDGTI